MSPAGIPMFYGAFEESTAFAETSTTSGGGGAAVARFATDRACKVVDLDQLPTVPSTLDDKRRGTRWGHPVSTGLP